MGAEFLQLVADIFFAVLERVEVGGSNSSGSCAILDSDAQILNDFVPFDLSECREIESN